MGIAPGHLTDVSCSNLQPGHMTGKEDKVDSSTFSCPGSLLASQWQAEVHPPPPPHRHHYHRLQEANQWSKLHTAREV